MQKNQFFSVLLLAAGSANRFGADIPKQYQDLCGKPVIRHAIDAFLSYPLCKTLQVVINQEHSELYRKAIGNLTLPVPIFGGTSRKKSCYSGLKSIEKTMQNNVILVHDAARPFISHADINHLLTGLETESSVTLGKPVSETLRRANTDHILTEKIDRTHCWALQTPQGFKFRDLINAHEKYLSDDDFTDDCGVMEANGHQTKVIRCSGPNIKITFPEDLMEAEKIMSQQKITVIGQGFDVHAFGNDVVNNIRLGGIDVPYSRNLMAHSDGDVVLHTLTDALLGAVGEGDIGLHFPPSDPQWKNKDSAFFLNAAHDILKSRQADIHNIDITIICEEPKLTPVRESMREKIAHLLGANKQIINIKATTTEKLGFTGRGEGIACQAVVSASIVRKHDNA